MKHLKESILKSVKAGKYGIFLYPKDNNELKRMILDEIKKRQDEKISGCNDRVFAPEYIKMVLDDMIEDYGVDYLFYCAVLI